MFKWCKISWADPLLAIPTFSFADIASSSSFSPPHSVPSSMRERRKEKWRREIMPRRTVRNEKTSASRAKGVLLIFRTSDRRQEQKRRARGGKTRQGMSWQGNHHHLALFLPWGSGKNQAAFLVTFMRYTNTVPYFYESCTKIVAKKGGV